MGKKTDLESVHLVNHSKCMMAAFQNFRQDETMLDVTLACNGLTLKAHKLVLSACSPFFKDLFAENPCTHPIIILRNFEFADLKAVIDFIYKGELSVPRERLMSALKVAEELQIRGLRRSEPNREKYEKLYNQVCEKLSNRKKRKRRHRNSSDSEEREYLSVTDSDEDFVESDESLNENCEMPLLDSQPMDIESRDLDSISVDDKDSRPVVLRVGDPIIDSEESNSKNSLVEEESGILDSMENNMSESDVYKRNADSVRETDVQNIGLVPENSEIASGSQIDSFTSCQKNSSLLEANFKVEQTNLPVEGTYSVTSVECSEEQSGTISSSCLSPEPVEAQRSDETKYQEAGKRFVCTECSCIFTSRINFSRHKMHEHNNKKEICLFKCEHCSFSTEDPDSLKSHLLTHSSQVPYKCSVCSQEFDLENLYNEHLLLHHEQQSSLHEPSLLSEDLFSSQSRTPEIPIMFRCSVCLTKFTSKLTCQIHERMCQGGS